ncbi:hypothetical protein ACW0US_19240 [Xanthomonas euvesicatoria]|uniref:hypothetical protein n=1 Tax=Xanthomonas euvesicatoria TaxID=456327 RepID=UPI001E2C058C|nr:hypothetical protein [Xanthomonas euvesicatoria]
MSPNAIRMLRRSYCVLGSLQHKIAAWCGQTRAFVGVLEEHSDNIANTGADVIAPQGGEPQEWGGGVHDAHVASASQTDTTMNCAAFQGAAR